MTEPTTGRDEYTPTNHPLHYNVHPAGVECVDVVEGFGFCIGNAIKYLWRADAKDQPLEDLRKALWYVQREIDRREKHLPSIQEIRGIMADVRAAVDDYPRQLGVAATVAIASEPDGEEPEQRQCLIPQEHPRHHWGHRDLGEVECPGLGCQDFGKHPAHYSERSGTQCLGRAYDIIATT